MTKRELEAYKAIQMQETQPWKITMENKMTDENSTDDPELIKQILKNPESYVGTVHKKFRENKMTEKDRNKFNVEEELKKGYITDEEADIQLRKIEGYHIKHANDICSPLSRRRPILPERWDLLPAIALREVAEIMYRGQDKHPQDDWKEVDFNSEQSPLNRAIAHAYKASEMAPHSKERTRQLAKAACRLLMQLWWELQEEGKDENNS